MATKRATKPLQNACDRENGGRHNYEVVNLTVQSFGMMSGTVIPNYVAFCRACAKTVPIVSR